MVLIKEHDVDWTPIADIKPAQFGRGYSTFSPEEGERIRQFWREMQIPVSWIKRHFGLPHDKTIHNVCQRLIKYDRPTVREMSESALRRVWKRYMHGGVELKQLAAELKTRPEALRSLFRRRGWETRWARTQRDRYLPEVEAMTRQGKSAGEIADKLSIGRSTVVLYRRKIRERIMKGISND